MQRFTVILALLVFGLPTLLRADELTRQVQEELRRRHLFFSEIDGRNTPDVVSALKRYQERQGFVQTGVADEVTLRSLGVVNDPTPPAEGGAEVLPDIPVLRSDSKLPEMNALPPLPPPTPNPANTKPISKAEAAEFVQRYLAACESPSINDELGFYSDRVDYFDHGVVDRQYVKNELAAYDQRWARRTYKLSSPVRAQKNGKTMTAKFRVAFQVANMPANRAANGRTDETFGLDRRADGGLEIVSIREERVRNTPRSRRGRHGRGNGSGSGRRDDPVVRSVGKVFHSIFHQ